MTFTCDIQAQAYADLCSFKWNCSCCERRDIHCTTHIHKEPFSPGTTTKNDENEKKSCVRASYFRIGFPFPYTFVVNTHAADSRHNTHVANHIKSGRNNCVFFVLAFILLSVSLWHSLCKPKERGISGKSNWMLAQFVNSISDIFVFFSQFSQFSRSQ